MKVLPRNTMLAGDARDVLGELLPESVDTVLTSPPYPLGARNYLGHPDQLGQEPTIGEYVANLTEVLRLVHRAMKPTASLFLVLGDRFSKGAHQGAPRGSLLLTPQRIALALGSLGFTLRGYLIWQKPNPKPESARDRFSQTYEVVLFATKGRRYFFDLDAVRIPHRSAGRVGAPRHTELGRLYQGGNDGLGKLKAAGRVGNPRGKNPGDVFTVSTPADRSGHQATFPRQLIEPMILSSCPESICVQCDRAFVRPTRIVSRSTNEGMQHTREVGKLRRCDCFAPSRPGVVLDPFCGLNTTGLVAECLGRDWLGIELNPTFTKLAEDRLRSARESRRAGGRLRGGRKGSGLSARRKSQPLTKGGAGR